MGTFSWVGGCAAGGQEGRRAGLSLEPLRDSRAERRPPTSHSLAASELPTLFPPLPVGWEGLRGAGLPREGRSQRRAGQCL